MGQPGVVCVGTAKPCLSLRSSVQIRRAPGHRVGRPLSHFAPHPREALGNAHRFPDENSTIGAGDTFIAGILYGLRYHAQDWPTAKKLDFANRLAGQKVLQEGFAGLVDAVERQPRSRQSESEDVATCEPATGRGMSVLIDLSL